MPNLIWKKSAHTENRKRWENTYRKVKAYDLLLNEKIEYPFIRENQAENG